MTALWWACGEEIEFPNKGGEVSTQTSTGIAGRRTAWTRAALGVLNSGAAGALSAESFPIATPRTTLWASLQWFPGGNNISTTRAEVGLARSGTGSGGIYIARNGSSKAALATVTASNVTTVLVTEPGNSVADNTLVRVDLLVSNFNTATANIKLYLAGNATPTLEWTGSLTGLGFTDLDILRVRSNGTNGGSAISEVILADEDTRAFAGVMSLAANGAGSVNTFTSGTYTEVDEITLNDADLIQSVTVGQEFNCTLTDITVPGTYTIRGVKVAARAAKGATGPTTLQIGINSAGTRNVENRALQTALLSYERLMLLNPITGLRFTPAEVNALEVALKSAT